MAGLFFLSAPWSTWNPPSVFGMGRRPPAAYSARNCPKASIDHHVRARAGVPILGGDLDVVLQRVPVVEVASEVAHHVPAAGGREPHRLLAGPAQPYGQPVLERACRDRGGAFYRVELPVECEVPLGQR